MNELVIGNTERTMSSREIADLCGKEHKIVLRDIRSMLISLYGEAHLQKVVPEQYRNRHSEYIRENADSILNALFGDGTNWNHENPRGFSWKRDSRGYVELFNLDKEHSLTLVSGYNVKLRKAIIDKWQQLENEVRQAFDPMQALNDPATMRGLLLNYSEKVLNLETKVMEIQPKADALDRLSTANGSLCLTDSAKNLQARRKDLIDYLHFNKWIYKRPGGKDWIAYSDKERSGLLEHKTITITTPTGEERIQTQVRITPKGLAKLATIELVVAEAA